MPKKFRVKGLVAGSFADGFRKAFVRARVTDDDILAACQWLMRHGRPDEAEMLLEDYCAQ